MSEKKSEYEAYYETIDKYRKQLTARSDAKHVQKSVQCPESIEVKHVCSSPLPCVM